MTVATNMADPVPQDLDQESTSAFGTHSMTDYDESAIARAQYLERSSRQFQLQQMQHQQLTTDENPLSNEAYIPVEYHPAYHILKHINLHQLRQVPGELHILLGIYQASLQKTHFSYP